MGYLVPSKEEEEAFSYAMQLGSAIVLPAVLQAVIELEVFDIINRAGPGAKLSASEIVAHIPNKNPEAATMLDRVMGVLVSFNVLHCTFVAGERLYSLTPVAKYYVRDQNGVSLLPYMNLSLDKVVMPSWFELKNQIVGGGISFHRVHGKQIYEQQAIDSRFNEVFNNAMYSQTYILMNKILDVYKGFENIKQLVEVGGGLGITLNIITSKYPHIKGINFDLPHLIKDAPSTPRVEHVGGDMFQKIPEGDAILMKWLIHSFDDKTCVTLLKNCYKAIPDTGKVLLINSALPEVPEDTTASRDSSIVDAILLIQIPSGKERTKQEFETLAIAAGFKGVNFECGICNSYVMEFYK